MAGAQINVQNGNGRRGDAWDARGFPQYRRPHPLLLIADLARQAGNAGKAEFRRDAPPLGMLQALHLSLLLQDVSAVLGLRLHRVQKTGDGLLTDRKSTRLNSSHANISY